MFTIISSSVPNLSHRSEEHRRGADGFAGSALMTGSVWGVRDGVRDIVAGQVGVDPGDIGFGAPARNQS
jgi:hypothetical protein